MLNTSRADLPCESQSQESWWGGATDGQHMHSIGRTDTQITRTKLYDGKYEDV